MSEVVIIAPEGLPIPPTRGGSVQIYLHHLAEHLWKISPFDTHLICPAGNAVEPVPPITMINATKESYREKVLSELKRLSPTVIQVDNRPSLIPILRHTLPDAKLLLNLHSTTFLGKKHVTKQEARRTLRACDAVVLNSLYLRHEIERRFDIKRSEWNSFVVHPGVDSKVFRVESTDRGRVPQSPIQLLFVGRVIKQKGVHVLIEAVRILHKRGIGVHLAVVGNTHAWEKQYFTSLRTQAEGLPIVFTGFIAHKELPAYYKRSDVFICPSQGDEAFGMVNIEALASGLPVVGSRVGGIKEIVNDDCGVLVKHYTDPRAIADAILQVIESEVIYARLRVGAQKRAARFTWHRTAREFAEIYHQLIMMDALEKSGP